ncbi:MAG: hypothetical protein ACRENA_10190, partial [Vulcanimicrobiaceae bacterium]
MEALVRRSLIALVGATLQSPAPRYVKSPAFARRIDAAPSELRDAIGARLATLKISLPSEPPEPPRAVDTRALRAVVATLRSLASREADAPERILQ